MTIQNYTDFRGDDHTKNGHWNDPPSAIFSSKNTSNSSSTTDINSQLTKAQIKAIDEDFKQGLNVLSPICAQAIDKKILLDTEQRLNILFSWLNQFKTDQATPSVSDIVCLTKLQEFCQAITSRSYETCYSIQTELITLQLGSDLTKTWVGLKRYADLYKKYFQ